MIVTLVPLPTVEVTSNCALAFSVSDRAMRAPNLPGAGHVTPSGRDHHLSDGLLAAETRQGRDGGG
jgi:hypothetical protein